ncbi:HNH endonuclease signature motif containing protein [Mycobacterium asiaticum]|uniref:HNH nuclease n=1 Tax=Mycobacterium asiaticum TaxID=1790 RepID=A0A1A3MW59_MYCAS|nr:HNH endonuclease signature motif containing protein [Mycobacterium asiaticum]OBK14138.1 HNH nuclease [Mycobacterium asiaticum]
MFDSMSDLDPADLVATIEATHRTESVLVAQRMAAVAALLRQRRAAAELVEDQPGYSEIDGFDQTKAEVAAAMNLSPLAASYLVLDAEALDTRLPQLAALLAEGRVDWRTVRLIISRTALVVDDELVAKLDGALAARIGNWRSWSRQRIVNEVDAAVKGIDPDAARERREGAEDDRHVRIDAMDNGMAEISGTVTATAATAFDRVLSQLARQVCVSDPRTMDQRRADALGALAQGRVLPCRCGEDGCPAASVGTDQAPGGARVVINVVAAEQTVLGDSAQHGYLMGYGVVDAEQVRQLVASAAVHVVDPYTSPIRALDYQPSAALVRAVQCRDLTCRFPGCSRPAVRCDLDHTIPFNHQDPDAGGKTVFENLKCLCRQHHLLKTFGGWRDRQLSDGTVIWTSPTGHVYTTQPAGADLFPQLGAPVCAPPVKNRHNRFRQRASRIKQARRHNREQRPVNERRRWLEEARRQELANRRFRNRMRDMLAIFKGTPSTSPFCKWVNDPREPEVLPDDWQPEFSTPDPLPDDPPF